MKLGLGLGITRLQANSFSPAQLPDLVAWYDPSDLSTLWQDTAGTTPVTASGQSVARIDDKSGNGYHLTQSTAAARPTYQSSGGLHWLESDGVDDLMQAGSRLGLGADPDLSVITSLRNLSSDSDDRLIHIGDNTPTNLSLSIGTAGTSWRYDDGNVIFADFTGDTVVTWARSTGDLYRDAIVGLDGVYDPYISTATGGSSVNSTGDEFTLFAKDIGALFANVRLYGLVVTESNNAADRSRAETYLADKAGISL